MRVAVVTIAEGENENLKQIGRGLARGIEKQGYQVDIFSMRDVPKLTIYNYIAIGTMQTSFFGKTIPSRVSKCLANCGTIAGRNSFAFVARKLIGSERALYQLMKQMEHEGMHIRYSSAIAHKTEGEAIGELLHIN